MDSSEEACQLKDRKVFFQLNHAGQQTSPANLDQTPLGPSSSVRYPINIFIHEHVPGGCPGQRDGPKHAAVEKTGAWLMIQSLKRKYDLDERYNLTAARAIEPVTGNIPLSLVGGMHTMNKMSQVVTNQDVDLRPLNNVLFCFSVRKMKMITGGIH